MAHPNRAMRTQPGDDSMGRMPVNGVAISAPFGSKDELRRALVDLGVGHAFDADAIDSVYWRLGQIIGSSHQERERLEVETVAKALLATANHSNELSKILGGLESGLQGLGSNLRQAAESGGSTLLPLLKWAWPAQARPDPLR
jgi:hypothetical protein